MFVFTPFPFCYNGYVLQRSMNFFLVLVIAFALAMDAFAVSVGISLGFERITGKQILRLATYFGVFQFMMTVLGWLAGRGILNYIQAFDHWIAFGLLFIVGLKMIMESFGYGRRTKKINGDPTKGISLIILSVATSIDALAVGLSLVALYVAILYSAIIIGIVAFLMTVLGTKIGPVIGRIAGKKAEFFGGLVLIFIGVKIFLEHL